MKLTAKHKRFADEYLIDMNASASYLRAGYASKNPDVDGYKLLVKPSIQEYIQKRMKERENRTEITQDRILQEYGRIALFDPRKMFNDNGTPKGIHELDDDTAAVVAGLDVQEVYEGYGEDRKFVGYIKKWKLADKIAALDSAARHLGMFIDRKEITGKLVMFKGEGDLED